MTSRAEQPTIRLRLLAPDDYPLYQALYGDPETMRFIAPPLEPARCRRSFLATCRMNTESPPRARCWVIHEDAVFRDIGLIGLRWTGKDSAELGVVLPPAWQGKGYASSSISLLLESAFAGPGLAQVHTRHDPRNLLASGLMEKLGFERKATLAADEVSSWETLRDGWIRRRARE